MLFAGKLKRVSITYGCSKDDLDDPVYGFYDSDPYEARIHIDKRCRTKRAILDTLAHEMVHQYQHEAGLPLTHGRTFKAYAKKAAKHGLTL